jgi:pilus assembly protein CpaE
MIKLLVIDDDPIYLKMIARALPVDKYQLVFAESGRQGIEKAHEHLPDLIITDVMMPDIQGYELAKILRRETQFAQTPILVLTAQTGLEDKLKSFEAGADDFLTKPFEPAELEARVSVLVRRLEALRQVTQATSAPAEKARMIAVHSLRGGVGTSSIAVNLAVSLHALWHTPVLLVDLTMTAGQVALMLNMTLKRTWADISGMTPDGLDADVLGSILSKHESGISFVPAPASLLDAEMLAPETLGAALDQYAGQFDYIVADLPHDFSGIGLQALDRSDIVLVAGSPDIASVRAFKIALDTYASLGYPEDKVKLILNAIFPQHGLNKEKIQTALGRPITLTIPYSPDSFVPAINYGQPIVHARPEEPVSGLLEDLAFFLSREKNKKATPEQPSEAWRRVRRRYQKKPAVPGLL